MGRRFGGGGRRDRRGFAALPYRSRMSPNDESLARHWLLDPTILFLNHGSFGACPRPVLEAQRRWRDRLEAEPVLFLDRELEGALAEARADVAAFVGAEPDDLAFVPNATTGVATVLASLRFEAGDELLTTDHEYNAALNALRRAAARDRARVVVAHIPFPIADPAEAVEAILGSVTTRTRFALVSHVTSPTAVVLPIARIVAELADRGVDTLVDGAHAPGMVALDVRAVGAAYYTGNGHKWLCAPKGSGFLHVRRDRQALIHPLVTSHGANSARTDRSRFRLEADWTGTNDPSAHLALPAAIRFMGSLLPGGWPELIERNHASVLAGRDRACAAIGARPPAPDALLGSLASIELPMTDASVTIEPGAERDPLQVALFERHRIEVPVMTWPVPAALEDGRRPERRLIRISSQAYLPGDAWDRLARALAAGATSPAPAREAV
jgi:isopenicillin-N epimerase